MIREEQKTKLIKVLKVAAWSSVSTFLAVIIAGLQEIELSGTAAAFVPIINTILYSLKDTANSIKDMAKHKRGGGRKK